MPLLMGIAWGLALAYAAGGSLGGIEDRQLSQLWFVIPLFVVQGFARGRMGLHAFELGLLLWAGAAIVVCAYVLWRVTDIGLRLIGLGFASNLLVVLLNGQMPVSLGGLALRASSAGFYGAVNRSTILGFLGDVMPLALFGARYMLSVGDVLLWVGATLYLWGLMLSASESEATVP